MSYEVHLTQTFQKSIKILNKKYSRIKDDLLKTIQQLEVDPAIGNSIPGWNNEVWKIRTASSDVKKGKSGGFRTVYFQKAESRQVYLLFTYFKGEKVDISRNEIQKLLRQLMQEMELTD